MWRGQPGTDVGLTRRGGNAYHTAGLARLAQGECTWMGSEELAGCRGDRVGGGLGTGCRPEDGAEEGMAET